MHTGALACGKHLKIARNFVAMGACRVLSRLAVHPQPGAFPPESAAAHTHGLLRRLVRATVCFGRRVLTYQLRIDPAPLHARQRCNFGRRSSLAHAKAQPTRAGCQCSAPVSFHPPRIPVADSPMQRARVMATWNRADRCNLISFGGRCARRRLLCASSAAPTAKPMALMRRRRTAQSTTSCAVRRSAPARPG